MIKDLWYKNAVIYCLNVGTFMDSNGDGVGDFEGLVRRLDYLAGLGVTCLWLHPFQKSPRRDGGYDISDYYQVDPIYGSIGDFVDFTHEAKQRGIRVIIAGAGGAAHLPGMLASVTTLPVIGVPVPLARLDGLDSLLSIVQMPAGIPVATVSIGGARNAGLLAVRVLAAGDGEYAAGLRERMLAFQGGLRDLAHAKGAALRERRS